MRFYPTSTVPFSLGFSINHPSTEGSLALTPLPFAPCWGLLHGCFLYTAGRAWQPTRRSPRGPRGPQATARTPRALSRATPNPKQRRLRRRAVTPGAGCTACPSSPRVPAVCTTEKACTDAPGPRATHRSHRAPRAHSRLRPSTAPGGLRASPLPRCSRRSRSEADPTESRPEPAAAGRGRGLGSVPSRGGARGSVPSRGGAWASEPDTHATGDGDWTPSPFGTFRPGGV